MTAQDSLDTIRSLRSPVRVSAASLDDAALISAFHDTLTDIIGVRAVRLEQADGSTVSYLVDTISPGALLTSLRRLPQFPVTELEVVDGEITVRLPASRTPSEPPHATPSPAYQPFGGPPGPTAATSADGVTELGQPPVAAIDAASATVTGTKERTGALAPSRIGTKAARRRAPLLLLVAIVLLIVGGSVIVVAQRRRSGGDAFPHPQSLSTVATPVPVSLAAVADAGTPGTIGTTAKATLVNPVDAPTLVVSTAAPTPPAPEETAAAESVAPAALPSATVPQAADLTATAILAALQQRGIAITKRPDEDASGLLGAAVPTLPQPASRVIFTDPDLDEGSTAQGLANGGAIEVFATVEDAETKRAYLQRIGAVVPAVAERDERVGAVLLRLSARLTPERAAAYTAALQSAMGANAP